MMLVRVGMLVVIRLGWLVRLNTYSYVGGHPVNFIDPFGLATWTETQALTPGVVSTPDGKGTNVVKGRCYTIKCNDGREQPNQFFYDPNKPGWKDEMFEEINQNMRWFCPYD